jgi:hypothetical protein
LTAVVYASGATISGTVTSSRFSDFGRAAAFEGERTAARTW